MTGQQIFYQLLQCCPYDKTGFDAEEWESICQMAGAGLDSWDLVKIMSKGKPICDSWMFRLIESYYAPNSPITKHFVYDLQKIKAMFSDDIF